MSQRAYDVTREQCARLERALARLDATDDATESADPVLLQAMRNGAQSVLDELHTELSAYEQSMRKV